MRIKKNRFSIACIFALLSVNVYGQDGGDKSYLPDYIPPSPEASSLGQYGDHPVSYFTGIPQISIPLFEIESGRIKVPISLSYHASGIKVEQIASRVGLGWSLNAGGVVTRTVAGYADEKEIGTSCGSVPCEMFGFFNLPNNWDQTFPNTDPESDIYDTEPDQHFYSLPGRSGKFYFKNRTDYILTNKEDIIISSPYDGGHFAITTEDGLIYRFEQTETTWTFKGFDGLNYSYISSWYLSEIEDPQTGKTVTFTYNGIDGNLLGDKISSKTYSNVSCFGHNPTGTTISSTTTSDVKILSRIDYDGGYVVFETNSNDREDLEFDKAYKSIKKYNSNDDLIGGYSFATSYIHEAGNTNTEAKRLFLNSISEISSTGTTEQRYAFDYITPSLLPPRDSKEQDIWGYFNDNNATSFEPDIYEDSNNFGKTRYSVFNEGTRTLVTTGGFDRQSNVNTIDIGTLNKITYPTKGYAIYNYEPHVFSNISGGGIRIADITNYDSNDSFLTRKKYTYSVGSIPGAIPQAAVYSQGSGITTFYRNRSHLGSNEGSFVGYDIVREFTVDQNENSLGLTQYQFWNEPDTPPIFDIHDDCENTAKFSYYPFFTWTSNEIKRGVIKKLSYWKETGQNTPLKVVDYNYQRISHEHEPIRMGAATAKGLKFSAIRNVFSEKMLLTSKVETDYDDEGNGFSKTTTFTYYDEFPDGIHNLALKTRSENTGQEYNVTTEYKYPFNFDDQASGGVMHDMVEMHYVSPVIEELTYGSNGLISAVATDYAIFGTYPNETIQPTAIYATNISTPLTGGTGMSDPLNPGVHYEQRLNYLNYDATGNPILIEYDDHFLKLIWSWDGKLKAKMEVPKSDSNPILFPPQSWAEVTSTDAKTGTKYYASNGNSDYPDPLSDSETHTISFWAKNGNFSLSTCQGEFNVNETAPSGWTFYSYDFNPQQTTTNCYLGLSGDAKVDEVRYFKGDAMITTYYYDDFDRIHSICDPSNSITYYEYDEFGRLSNVKDTNGDIVQTKAYNLK